jgi:c-di-GMP-related signal transduction protein
MESFIARQPILDERLRVYAYEMLYRSGPENVARCSDFSHASAKVISDCCLLLDRAERPPRKKAFINVTRETLCRGDFRLLPPGQTVVELLESVEPDAEVLAACQGLKAAGYALSLDDFVYDPKFEPLMELADFAKIDFLSTSRAERRALAGMFRPLGVSLVAEKVEDRAAFEEARSFGYTHFQGYFFQRPEVMAWKEVPACKLHYLRILEEAQRPEPDFGRLAEMVRSDVALSYKLLRYINSAAVGGSRGVATVRQAILMLGEREFRRWVALFALVGVARDKPEELLVQSLVRAKFCESLAPLAGLSASADDLLLTGLFSLIDALLDRPLGEILSGLALREEVKAALLGEAPGSRLRTAYECVLSYERGAWGELAWKAGALGVGAGLFPELYLRAVEWVAEYFERPG